MFTVKEKILEINNIEVSLKSHSRYITHSNCEGCLSIMKFHFQKQNHTECCLTSWRTTYIANCPCFNCIVKMVCGTICTELCDHVNKFENKYQSVKEGQSKIISG